MEELNTTEQLKKELSKAEKDLSEKKELSWIEKQALKTFIKRTKKNLQKELEKTKKNLTTQQELDQKITNAILEMKEHFDINIEQYNENGTTTKDKKGIPIEVEATPETLTYMPLKEKIRTFEQILEELQKIVWGQKRWNYQK